MCFHILVTGVVIRISIFMHANFNFVYSLPCLLCYMCLKDTCMVEENMITDPRRLYAPGRVYHIVERKPFRYVTLRLLFHFIHSVLLASFGYQAKRRF